MGLGGFVGVGGRGWGLGGKATEGDLGEGKWPWHPNVSCNGISVQCKP